MDGRERELSPKERHGECELQIKRTSERLAIEATIVTRLKGKLEPKGEIPIAIHLHAKD